MKLQYIAIAAVSLAVTACAGTPAGGKTASSEKGKICTYEKTTGSKIGHRICRTPAQVEAEKVAAQKAMKTLNRSGASPVGG